MGVPALAPAGHHARSAGCAVAGGRQAGGSYTCRGLKKEVEGNLFEFLSTHDFNDGDAYNCDNDEDDYDYKGKALNYVQAG